MSHDPSQHFHSPRKDQSRHDQHGRQPPVNTPNGLEKTRIYTTNTNAIPQSTPLDPTVNSNSRLNKTNSDVNPQSTHLIQLAKSTRYPTTPVNNSYWT